MVIVQWWGVLVVLAVLVCNLLHTQQEANKKTHSLTARHYRHARSIS